jgi:HSP20 family protein
MEVAMSEKSVLPITRERRAAGLEPFAFSSLRREMDRLFDEFASGFGLFAGIRGDSLLPRVNVAETDGDIEFTAELPGLEEKDVEVTLADNLLTIRGEKKEEKEDKKDKEYRVMERRYGAFSRSFEVPAGVETSAIKASIEKGVLTVNFPKPAQAAGTKIEVKAAA